MTPAQQHGIEVGDKVFISEVDQGECIAKLIEDDGSVWPWFEVITHISGRERWAQKFPAFLAKEVYLLTEND